MRKILCTIVGLILFFANTAFSDSFPKILTVEYPPYIINQEKGLALDMLSTAFQNEGATPKIKIESFGRLTNFFLKKKDVPILVSEDFITYNKELDSKDFIFVRLMKYRSLIFYNKEKLPDFEATIKSIDDLPKLKGRKMGIMTGDTSIAQLYDPYGIKFESANTLEQNIRKLYKGRIDMFDGLDISLFQTINKFHPDWETKIAYTKFPIFTENICVIFHKTPENQNFANMIEAGMKKVRISGKYMELMQQYYGNYDVPNEVIIMN